MRKAKQSRDPGFYIDEQMGEAVIRKWTPALGRALQRPGVDKLRIRGWDQPGLGQLVPFGRRFKRVFVESDIRDVSAIAEFSRLRELAVRDGVQAIDFSRLQRLDVLSVWSTSSDFGNLSQTRSLRVLRITNCGLRDLRPLATLARLRELEILEAPLRSVEGIARLKSMNRLVLLQCPLGTLDGLERAKGLSVVVFNLLRRLGSVGPLTSLKGLKRVDIGGARKIADLDSLGALNGLEELRLDSMSLPSTAFLGRLKRLRVLVLWNVGRIPSLQFLRKLRSLETLGLVERTIVEDGDMSVLDDLPALKKVDYTERRHYKPRRDAIRRSLAER